MRGRLMWTVCSPWFNLELRVVWGVEALINPAAVGS